MPIENLRYDSGHYKESGIDFPSVYTIIFHLGTVRAVMKTSRNWNSPSGRIAWLLEHLYDGSRSAMAKSTKISLPGIIKVVTGQQEPGRRLMASIVENTDVNAEWLLVGRGAPLPTTKMPVLREPIACSLEKAGDKLAVESNVYYCKPVGHFKDDYSASRYWLCIQPNTGATRDPDQKIRAHDYLLMETERKIFPDQADFNSRICSVRHKRDGKDEVELAAVTFVPGNEDDGDCFEADFFDEVRHDYTEVSVVFDGSKIIHQTQRKVQEIMERNRRSRSPKFAEVEHNSNIQGPRGVDYADIVAVCLKLVRVMR